MPYGGIEIRKNKAVPLIICIVRHKVVQNETDLNSHKTISSDTWWCQDCIVQGSSVAVA